MTKHMVLFYFIINSYKVYMFIDTYFDISISVDKLIQAN